MRSATDARNGLNALLADAQEGLNTHVMKGSQIAAHIVPANAAILDDERLMADMIAALAAAAAAAVTASGDWREGHFGPGAENMGRLLTWTWRTDAKLFEKAFSDFHVELQQQSGQAIEFSAVWEGLRPALTLGVEGGEITEMGIALARSRENQA
ncbi:hypothetical protein BVC93_30920 (plasmid) [Mycobacterium sp. MS1601]|nr:hypothetical protein BVC93_30920 [Mycobacterium sp. MS1601]